jgi:hypothetical protein
MKKGRRKTKRSPWVKVDTMESGVVTGRKGAMPVPAEEGGISDKHHHGLDANSNHTSVTELAVFLHGGKPVASL